jgi:spore coat polysaccharide biosynthesis predicted glycosyltransferase SpsG
MNYDEKFSRLRNAALKIKHSENTSFFFMRDVIRDLGVRYDDRNLYYDEKIFMSKDSGLWQEPNQFASLLSFLSNQTCETYCEIGPCLGWSTVLICAALSVKNKSLKILGIDPYVIPDKQIAQIIEELGSDYFHTCETSDSLKNQKFDIVFIDGNHEYEWVSKDWHNIGQHSKICFFHDINDLYCEKLAD